MLKIRLTRRGKRNKAFFRLVVAEHTSPIKGRFLEALGFFNPHTKEKSFKADRIKYWIGKGAQCSDTAHNLLVKEGIIEGPKRAVKMKKVEPEPAEGAPSSAEASAADKSLADKPVEEKKEEIREEKTEAKAEEKKPEEVKTEKKEVEPARNASPSDAGGEKKEEK